MPWIRRITAIVTALAALAALATAPDATSESFRFAQAGDVRQERADHSATAGVIECQRRDDPCGPAAQR
jgi:hypothetical protein